jgi:hypothetical protein
MLGLLETFARTQNFSFLTLDGSTPAGERPRLIQKFNDDPTVSLFLISTKAGGVGLNLTAACKVVIFDVNWNPTHDLQVQLSLPPSLPPSIPFPPVFFLLPPSPYLIGAAYVCFPPCVHVLLVRLSLRFQKIKLKNSIFQMQTVPSRPWIAPIGWAKSRTWKSIGWWLKVPLRKSATCGKFTSSSSTPWPWGG